MGGAEEYELSLNVPLANLGSISVGVGVENSTSSSPEVRRGPQTFYPSDSSHLTYQNRSRNQTVFVHYMRGKPRTVGRPRIIASGSRGSYGSDDSGDQSDTFEISMEHIPGSAEVRIRRKHVIYFYLRTHCSRVTCSTMCLSTFSR